MTVQGSGDNAAIIVSVPGAVPQDRLVELVGRTAQLAFRQVEAILAPRGGRPERRADRRGVALGDPHGAQPLAHGARPDPHRGLRDSVEHRLSGPTRPPQRPSPRSRRPPPRARARASPRRSTSRRSRSRPRRTTRTSRSAGCAWTAPCPRTAPATPDDQALWLATCDRDGHREVLPAARVHQGHAGHQRLGAAGSADQQVVGLAARSTPRAQAALSKISADIYDNQPPQNQFAIVLDGVVFSAPSFLEPIPRRERPDHRGLHHRRGQRPGQRAEVRLPADQPRGRPDHLGHADRGEDYLRAGLLAGAHRPGCWWRIYLLALLPGAGLVAVASLGIAGVVSYCLFVVFGRTLGFTLTLAGIAGAIVAIGITADSFIVYFERIRDEVRDGRTLRVAAETGWIRARRTLLAADFVSLLGAVVLYVLSIGSVRGLRLRPGPDHRRSTSWSPSPSPDRWSPLLADHEVLPVGPPAQRRGPESPGHARTGHHRGPLPSAGRK